MPKHVPTFKHLVSTSLSSSPTKKKERSVNDLLASSREARERDRDLAAAAARDGHGRERPPHLWLAVDPGEGLLPCVSMPGSSKSQLNLVHELTTRAERLRLTEQSRRAAARSVAGPAPPLSWQRPAPPSAAPSTSAPRPPHAVSTDDLVRASALLTRRPAERAAVGPPRLVDICLSAVVRYIEDDTVVTYATGPAESDSITSSSFVLGHAVLEQAAYLDAHLIEGLLFASSILPEGARRLSDSSLRALLAAPASDGADDWDAPSSVAASTVAHLPLTLHASPGPALRELAARPLVALASLNLAYAAVPDLERLAPLLPAGLRELSLVGARVRGSGEQSWRRGLALLARRLIVLRTLDIGEAPFVPGPPTLAVLLHPADTRLPSLRLLGMRGNVPLDSEGAAGADAPGKGTGERGHEHAAAADAASPHETRRALEGVVRAGRRWVDIVWD